MPEGAAPTETSARPVTPAEHRQMGHLARHVEGKTGIRSAVADLVTPGSAKRFVEMIGATVSHPFKRESRVEAQDEVRRQRELDRAHAMGVHARASVPESVAQRLGIADENSEEGQAKVREYLQSENPQALRVLEGSEIAMAHRLSQLVTDETHVRSVGGAAGPVAAEVTLPEGKARGRGEAVREAQPQINVSLNEDGEVAVSMVMADPRINGGRGVTIHPDGSYDFVDVPNQQGKMEGSVIVSSITYRPAQPLSGGREGTRYADAVVNGRSVRVDRGNGQVDDARLQAALTGSLTEGSAMTISSRTYISPVDGSRVQVAQIDTGSGMTYSQVGEILRHGNLPTDGSLPVIGTEQGLERYRAAGLPGSENVATAESVKIPLQMSPDLAERSSHLTEAEFVNVYGHPRDQMDVRQTTEPVPSQASATDFQDGQVRDLLYFRQMASRENGQLTPDQENDPAYRLWNMDRTITVTTADGKTLSGVEAANYIVSEAQKAVLEARNEAMQKGGTFSEDDQNNLLFQTLKTRLSESGVAIADGQLHEFVDGMHENGAQAQLRSLSAAGDTEGITRVLVGLGLPDALASETAQKLVEQTAGLSPEQRSVRIRELATMNPDRAREAGDALLAGLPEDTPNWMREALQAQVEQQVAAAEKNGQTEETRTHFVERVQNGQVTVEELRELGLDVALTPRASSTPNKQ